MSTPDGFFVLSNDFAHRARRALGPAVFLYLDLVARADHETGRWTICLEQYAEEEAMPRSVVQEHRKRIEKEGYATFTRQVNRKTGHNSHLAYQISDYRNIRDGGQSKDRISGVSPAVEEAKDRISGHPKDRISGQSQDRISGGLTVPVSTVTIEQRTTAPRAARRPRVAKVLEGGLFPAEMIAPPAPVSPEDEAIGAIHAVLLTDGSARFPRWRSRVQQRDLDRRVRQWVEDGATPERVREAIADPTTQTMQGVFALVGRWPKGRPQWGDKRVRNGQGVTHDAPRPETPEAMDRAYSTGADGDDYWTQPVSPARTNR